MIGRGAEKKAGREKLKVQLHQRSSQPVGVAGGVTGVLPFLGALIWARHEDGAPHGRWWAWWALPWRLACFWSLFWWRGERALMRTTEGVGFVWGVTGLLGPRFLVSRCVDRGPREEQEMHRWERHGRADRVFNATIPDEPRCACGPRLVDLVRGSVSGIWNLELGACSA